MARPAATRAIRVVENFILTNDLLIYRELKKRDLSKTTVQDFLTSERREVIERKKKNWVWVRDRDAFYKLWREEESWTGNLRVANMD